MQLLLSVCNAKHAFTTHTFPFCYFLHFISFWDLKPLTCMCTKIFIRRTRCNINQSGLYFTYACASIHQPTLFQLHSFVLAISMELMISQSKRKIQYMHVMHKSFTLSMVSLCDNICNVKQKKSTSHQTVACNNASSKPPPKMSCSVHNCQMGWMKTFQYPPDPQCQS